MCIRDRIYECWFINNFGYWKASLTDPEPPIIDGYSFSCIDGAFANNKLQNPKQIMLIIYLFIFIPIIKLIFKKDLRSKILLPHPYLRNEIRKVKFDFS